MKSILLACGFSFLFLGLGIAQDKAVDGFVTVPSGTFTMGSPVSEVGHSDNELQHQVSMSSFIIGKYQVTQADWVAIMGSNPSHFKGDSKPVTNVSWYDCLVYCNIRSLNEGLNPCYSIAGNINPSVWGTVPAEDSGSIRDGVPWDSVLCDFSANGYRLPTEAEWEYSAKGGPESLSLVINSVYAGSGIIDDVAWYSDNSGGTTHPVGQKKPNTLGLYDMAGNVWQWCWDWYQYENYSSNPQSDPKIEFHGGPPAPASLVAGVCMKKRLTFARLIGNPFIHAILILILVSA